MDGSIAMVVFTQNEAKNRYIFFLNVNLGGEGGGSGGSPNGLGGCGAGFGYVPAGGASLGGGGGGGCYFGFCTSTLRI